MVDYEKQHSDMIEKLIELFPKESNIETLYTQRRKEIEENALEHKNVQNLIPTLAFKDIRNALNEKWKN